MKYSQPSEDFSLAFRLILKIHYVFLLPIPSVLHADRRGANVFIFRFFHWTRYEVEGFAQFVLTS